MAQTKAKIEDQQRYFEIEVPYASDYRGSIEKYWVATYGALPPLLVLRLPSVGMSCNGRHNALHYYLFHKSAKTSSKIYQELFRVMAIIINQ